MFPIEVPAGTVGIRFIQTKPRIGGDDISGVCWDLQKERGVGQSVC